MSDELRMTSPDTCPLCDTPATLERRQHECLWSVDCRDCKRFTLEEQLLMILCDATTRQDPRIRALLPSLSLAAAKAWGEGGRLHITLENWRALAHDVLPQVDSRAFSVRPSAR